MFQIADRRWRIADVGNASCLVSAMNTQTSRPQVLQNRLISHAAEDISATLPKTPQATHVSRQLLRAGTAAAANYGEDRGAESRSDFVHKLRIVLKELNETAVWLQLILKGSWMTSEKISAVERKTKNYAR